MNLFKISIIITVIQFYGNIIARQWIEDIINISDHFLNLETVSYLMDFVL